MNKTTQGAANPPHIDTLTVSGRWSGFIVRNPLDVLTLGGGKAERIAREQAEDTARHWSAEGRGL